MSAGADISVAIETSCRRGGVALAAGDELLRAEAFDASARHAVQLVWRLSAMLDAAGFRPDDLRGLYVSAGPGSFTGLRIGVTVARTLAQSLPDLRCVAVPTGAAVAENARSLDWKHLAVVMDAREGRVWASLFARRDGLIVSAGTPRVSTPAELLAAWPRPVTVVGEGLAHCKFAGDRVETVGADSPVHLPTAEGVWRVGRRLARDGRFTDPARLLPIYSREPRTT